MKAPSRLVALISLALLGQVSAQKSFTLNLGGSANTETIKNSMMFSGGGVSAIARSWSVSKTESNAKLAQSEVVQWSPGLGSKNSSEQIKDIPYVPYYVDNEDHYDFILFVFDQKVDLTSLSVTPSGKTFDTDVSYFFGNVNEKISLTGVGLNELPKLGFGSQLNNNTSPNNAARSFGIKTPEGGINAILVGARIGGDSDFDRFKVSTIRGNTITAVPEPSAVGLIALGCVMASLRRRR